MFKREFAGVGRRPDVALREPRRRDFVRSVTALAASTWLAIGVASARAAAHSPALEQSPTLQRIATSGLIHVGYIPTPGTFAFRAADGATVGYSVEICAHVVDNIRKALARPDLRVVWRPLAPPERIPFLKAGTIDIDCGGNTNTVARQKDVDFSFTFFTTGTRFLVRQPLQFQGAGTLWKRTVAVTAGTTAQGIVERLGREQGVKEVVVASDGDGVKLVENGQADAFAQDDALLYGLMARSKVRDSLGVTGNFLTVEPYAFMLPKGDAAFREIFDRTLGEMMHSGELLALYRKWFDTDALRIPMNVYMKENLAFPSRYGVP